jgi:hypothetical protein
MRSRLSGALLVATLSSLGSLHAQSGAGNQSSKCSLDKANLNTLGMELANDLGFLHACAQHPLTSECEQEVPGFNEAVQNLQLEISSTQLQMLTDCAPPPPLPPNTFSVAAPQGVYPLPPCTLVGPGSVEVSWRQQTGLSVTLALLLFNSSSGLTGALPPGIQATFSPPQGFGDFVSSLTIQATPGYWGAPIKVVVQGTTTQIIHGVTQQVVELSQPFTIQAVPPVVSSFTPSGRTPQFLQPGTEVVVQGSGFCPGLQVQFGNSLAVVPPYFLTPIELHAPVASLATDGPITLLLNGGPYTVSSSSFAADSFRNTAAFSFHNYTPHTTFEQLTEAFGTGQTYDSIELCWPFDCTVSIRDPWAMIVNSIANSIFDNSGTGGACFGFALGSQRIAQGQVTLGNFPATWPVYPPGARTDFSLDSPNPGNGGTACCAPGVNACPPNEGTGASGPIIEFINSQNVSQLSNEMLAELLDASRHSTQDVYNGIYSNLLAGRGALISIQDYSGGFPPDGHSVVAYNLEGSRPPGEFDIDVYDSNDEFVPCENADTTGQTHQNNVQPGRIHVAADGSWTLSSTHNTSGNPFHGAIGSLIVTSVPSFPIQPTMIGAGSIGELLLFGLGGADSASPVLASRTTQVTDGAGHSLLDSNGNLNANPATRLNAVPYAPLVGGKARSEAFVVASNTPRVEQTVIGTAAAPDRHVLVAPGFVAQLSTQASPGVSDQIGFDPGRGVTFKTMAESKPLVMGLIRHAEGIVGSAEITITTSRGAGEDLRIDPKSSAVVLQHSGSPSTYRVRLSAQGKNAHAQTFDSGPLQAAANVTVSFAPSDWSKMDTVPMTVRDALGQETRKLLPNRLKAGSLGRIVTVHVDRATNRENARALEVTSRLKELPQNGEVAMAWSVQREGLMIAHGSRTLPSAALHAGPRSDRFEFDAKTGCRCTVRVDLIIITTEGVIRTAQTSSRSATMEIR